MIFPPVFNQTESLMKAIYDLDVLKAAFELHPITGEVIALKRSKSILKSALFSARIEGNPLTFQEISAIAAESAVDINKKEVFNLISLYEHIDSFVKEMPSKESLKDIHEQVLHGIFPSASFFRIEESAVWNQAGVAVYITPSPQQIFPLLDALLLWINESKEHPVIVAAFAHIWFEKIHPFDDGNGRVGRFLSAVMLAKGGFGFGGMVPLEEYFEASREEYYYELGKDKQDVTSFIEFFARGFAVQIQQSLKEVERVEISDTLSLSPRRAELVAIVRDHKSISFDSLTRRFQSVPSRSLHNDLSQLMKAGYIRKRGTTRGALYEPVT